jgi:hypothetical protein
VVAEKRWLRGECEGKLFVEQNIRRGEIGGSDVMTVNHAIEGSGRARGFEGEGPYWEGARFW